MKRFALCSSLGLLLLVFCSAAFAQKFVPNYDEAKVPKYRLPNPFVLSDGSCIETVEQWQARGRKAVLDLFKTEVYGQVPGVDPGKIKYKEMSCVKDALGGKATRKEIRIFFDAPKNTLYADLLLYIPNAAEKPVPAFLGLNFAGNHTVTSEKDIIDPGWIEGSRYSKDKRVDIRGSKAERWQADMVISRGYALATLYYEQIAPDSRKGWQSRAWTTLASQYPDAAKADNPSVISVWAWGLSRALDCLGKQKEINPRKVTVIGHSRLGKTALWAGANDTRFAAVISNNSGCGGAALSRREFGETVKAINDAAPHWFCENFKKYNTNVNAIPVDQHELIGLIAPRPIYVASATEDEWADPKGEFLAALKADPVYRLCRTTGFGTVTRWEPPHDKSVGDIIRYHLRTGPHAVTAFDWEQYLNFADQYVK
ncbi:MAG: acetylxylan esterase [Planctomycetia bacterium]|nr:acetylxylan esterase [Planctomycetia bacterium]